MKHVDLKTLTNQNREYIDKKIHKDFSDLLYQAEIDGKEGFIYFLFEHNSYEDQKVIFQLLCYMTRIWNDKNTLIDGFIECTFAKRKCFGVSLKLHFVSLVKLGRQVCRSS